MTVTIIGTVIARRTMGKMTAFLFIMSAAIFGAVLSNMMAPDTPIEEVTEELLEDYTGVNVDLSPGDNHK